MSYEPLVFLRDERRRLPRWPGSASSPGRLARRSAYPPQPARVTATPRPIMGKQCDI